MKKPLLIISLLLFSTLSFAQKDYPVLNSINDINKSTSDTCRINGVVKEVYVCPPCPKGMNCKPCPGDYIMVTDSPEATKQFRVFVKQPVKFSIGNKYALLVRLYKYNSEPQVYEGRLVGQE